MKQLSTSQKLLGVFALNLIAVFIHVYLTHKHYNLRFGDAQPSLCSINATFDCDTVAASKYSEFLGYPVALWGAVTNFILAVWALLLAYLPSASPLQLGSVVLSQGGLALVSVAMGVISFTQMHTYCLFCLALYVVSFLGLVPALSLKPKKSFDKISLFTNKALWSVLIAIPVLVWLIDGLYLKSYNSEEIHKYIKQALLDWQSEPVNTFATPVLHLSKGSDPNFAKVKVVEFADFLCPHCKHAAQKMDMFIKSHPDASFQFFFFPLDGECNAGITRPNPPRCLLAGLVYCAAKSGHGWLAHDTIFAQQEALATTVEYEKILNAEFATKGLNYSDLKACADLTETREALRTHAQLGANAKVQGTPAVFVNGRLLKGGQVLEILKAAYEKSQN